MNKNQGRIALLLNLILPWGVFGFTLLFVYASTLYPGGSQANINSIGFDWVNNYWCNLMSEKAVNGIINPARPFAVSAMMLLCLSISIFLFQFAYYLNEDKIWKFIISICGFASMLLAAMVFTKYHDLMTILSSLFGVVVVIGVIKTLYNSVYTFFKVAGLFSALLLIVNNLIYYSSNFLEWLPILQKITFFIILSWVIGINRIIRSVIKDDNNGKIEKRT